MLRTERWMASVAPDAPSVVRLSPGGIGEAAPGVRVRITVWLSSGSVSSVQSSAAAAAKAGTPGVTS